MPWTRKDLVSMQDIEPAEITDMLDTAEVDEGDRDARDQEGPRAARQDRRQPLLRGLDAHAHLLRDRGQVALADVINFSASGSSAEKGESFLDTAKNIEAMEPGRGGGAPQGFRRPRLLARHLKCSVVNAGDGAHEHPTQALLDLLTIRERKGHLEGLNVAIVATSPTAASRAPTSTACARWA